MNSSTVQKDTTITPIRRRRHNTFPMDDSRLVDEGEESARGHKHHLPAQNGLTQQLTEKNGTLIHVPRKRLSDPSPSRPRENTASSSSDALVPHTPWTVVLHKAETGRTVLYNRDEHKIVVQRTSMQQLPHMVTDDDTCPLCRRRLSRRSRTESEAGSDVNDLGDSFVNHDYFSLLSSIT